MQVGNDQYAENEQLINATMRQLDEEFPDAGGVEVTGHSLGGALAQTAAARNPDAPGHITTFQSAGVDNAELERLDAGNRERAAQGLPPLQADHFRVDNDIVPLAGDGFAPGEVHEMHVENERGGAIDRNLGSLGVNPVSAHMSHPVTAVSAASIARSMQAAPPSMRASVRSTARQRRRTARSITASARWRARCRPASTPSTTRRTECAMHGHGRPISWADSAQRAPHRRSTSSNHATSQAAGDGAARARVSRVTIDIVEEVRSWRRESRGGVVVLRAPGRSISIVRTREPQRSLAAFSPRSGVVFAPFVTHDGEYGVFASWRAAATYHALAVLTRDGGYVRIAGAGPDAGIGAVVAELARVLPLGCDPDRVRPFAYRVPAGWYAQRRALATRWIAPRHDASLVVCDAVPAGATNLLDVLWPLAAPTGARTEPYVRAGLRGDVVRWSDGAHVTLTDGRFEYRVLARAASTLGVAALREVVASIEPVPRGASTVTAAQIQELAWAI